MNEWGQHILLCFMKVIVFGLLMNAWSGLKKVWKIAKNRQSQNKDTILSAPVKVQRWRSLIALAEDLGSVPRTLNGDSQPFIAPVTGDLIPSYGTLGCCTYVVHTCICAGKTHSYTEKKINLDFKVTLPSLSVPHKEDTWYRRHALFSIVKGFFFQCLNTVPKESLKCCSTVFRPKYLVLK